MKKFFVLISLSPIEAVERPALTTVRAADYEAAALAGLRRALRLGQVAAPCLAYATTAEKGYKYRHENGLPMRWHGFTLRLEGKSEEGAAA